MQEEVDTYEESETRASGEIIKTYASGTTLMTAISLTPENLKYYPPGAYDIKDLKFYEVGSQSLKIKSVIKYNGLYYRIKEANDRSKDGNFTWYMTKQISADEMND